MADPAPRAPDGTAHAWHGPEGAPAVVLVHGFGLNRAMWQWQLPALARRFRVLTYDLYGHGESAAPPRAPDLALFAEQLLGLLDAAGLPRAAVAGFSLGGMIARRAAMAAPDRIRALAILNSPHTRTAEDQAAIEARVARARAEGPGASVEPALARWFTPAFREAAPETMACVRRWLRANDPASYAANYEVLAHGVAAVVAPDPPIRCPALVMAAEHDPGQGPEMARAIAAEIPGAELAILPGLRHMALAEAPDAVTAPLMRFLERALLPAAEARDG
jgi:pimeloyl-ACP methyl ester carboxylesterase